jgi:hypothetical protein
MYIAYVYVYFIGLESFFGKHGRRRNALVKSALDKLQVICDWFEDQSQVTFYSSSLLFIYEGDPSSASAKLPNGNSHEHNDEIHNNDRQEIHIGETEIHKNSEIHADGEDTRENSEISNHSGTKNGHSDERIGCDINDVDNIGGDCGVHSSCTSASNNLSSDEVTIKMIDFTHTYFENQKDENYLLGLRTLRKHLNMMLQK